MNDPSSVVSMKCDGIDALKRADSLLEVVSKWLVPRMQDENDKKCVEELRRCVEDDLERYARMNRKRKDLTRPSKKEQKKKQMYVK